MRFRHHSNPDDKARNDQYWFNNPPSSIDYEAFGRLRELLAWVDEFTRLCGEGEIVVTSFFRTEDRSSYHSICQAADIRSKDKSVQWWDAMSQLSKAVRVSSPDLQIFMHPELKGKDQEHIHVAIKNGALDNVSP